MSSFIPKSALETEQRRQEKRAANDRNKTVKFVVMDDGRRVYVGESEATWFLEQGFQIYEEPFND